MGVADFRSKIRVLSVFRPRSGGCRKSRLWAAFFRLPLTLESGLRPRQPRACFRTPSFREDGKDARPRGLFLCLHAFPSLLRQRTRVRRSTDETKLLQNCFHNAVNVREYVMIPEANDAKAEFFELPGSGFVAAGLLRVLSSVEFDDQPGFKRREIGDVAADRDLSPELVTIQPATAQMFPQQLFCFSPIAPKFARQTQRRTPSPYPLPHGERVFENAAPPLFHLSPTGRGRMRNAHSGEGDRRSRFLQHNAPSSHPLLMGRG